MNEVLDERQKFRRLRELNAYYVDKTMMIGEFLDSPYQITLITRPKRFGKTMNMSMLAEFLDSASDSKAIFEGTKVSRTEWMAELNQYPVVFLSFLNVKSDCSKGLLELIGETVKKEYERYSFLINASTLPDREKEKISKIYRTLADIRKTESWRICIIESIRTLCEVLSLYYGKNVYLFIDEYDTPFMSANTNGYYPEVRSVLAGFFSTSLKGNPYLERAMLTGVQYVIERNAYDGINNMTVLKVTDFEYEDCFGFTEEESRKLLEYCNLQFTNELKEIHGGYQFGRKELYNPWSVINYAMNKGGCNYLRHRLNRQSESFKKEFYELLANGKIYTVVQLTEDYYECHNDASLWGVLVNEGLVTIKKEMTDNYYLLRIPNKEAWKELKDIAV